MRFIEAQIIGFLREADADVPVKELCRKHGFSGMRPANRS
jgi:putative transposase